MGSIPLSDSQEDVKLELMPIADRTESDAGMGFIVGMGEGRDSQKDSLKPSTGKVIQLVELGGEKFLTMIDHDSHRLGCWQLVDNKWVEPADISDPLFKGQIMSGAKLSDYPPLPCEAM